MQPINTGFSYSHDPRDSVHDEDGVAADMQDFFAAFLAVHPELHGRPLFVTGESYAGHYVPAVAHALWQAQAAGSIPGLRLEGLAIGNGLTDPAIQFGAYADYAAQAGLISPQLQARLNSVYPLCRAAVGICNGLQWRVECRAGLQFCMGLTFDQVMAANPGINFYGERCITSFPAVAPVSCSCSCIQQQLLLPASATPCRRPLPPAITRRALLRCFFCSHTHSAPHLPPPVPAPPVPSGPTALRRAQEVQGGRPVLRLQRRRRLPQSRGHQGAAGRAHRPDLAGLQPHRVPGHGGRCGRSSKYCLTKRRASAISSGPWKASLSHLNLNRMLQPN